MALKREHYDTVRNHFITILGGKCAECGTTNNLELDHIIPIEWGGSRGRDERMWEWFKSHAEGNLQILCSTHNNQKQSSRKWR